MRFPRPARPMFGSLPLVALRTMMLPVMMLLAIIFAAVARAQQGPLDKSEPKGITVEEIIKRFGSKEKEFKTARDQYTFRQDVKVMTLDGDTPSGMYQQVFDVTFDDKAHKIKNLVYPPQSTIAHTRISMSEEDFDDIENR